MTTGASLGRRFEWAGLFLAGPVIWYLHFWFVYLVAEAGCVLDNDAASSPVPWLTAVVLVATAAAATLIGLLSLRAWLRWRSSEGDDSFRSQFTFIGFLLGLLFAVATLFVGVPAAFLPPC